MATLNFPDEPTTGDIYTDSNSGFTYEWNGTVWISSDPSTASNIREIDNISSEFDGSETDFTLKVAGVNIVPANVQQLIISVGGVMQNAGDDFTVNSSTLTFTTAPTAGLTFFGTYLGTALSLNTVADGSVSPGSLTTTSNYVMGGLTVDQSAGIVTAYQFKGDGSQLTGVASTDNITTQTDAYFGANVSIGGSLTVQGTETIINVEELNVQDKTVGIASTNAPTATTQDGAGAIIYGQTHINILYDVDKAALGISTGVNVSGFLTATRAQVGSGVTINNTGIDAGIGAGIITAKTYYGDATNMTGAGSTFQALSFDPYQGKTVAYADFSRDIVIGFNNGVAAGNAAKEITLRKSSASGTIVQSFGVGSSVTYSAGQAILNPTDALPQEETLFVVAPEGAIHKIGTASSSPVINTYSFVTQDFARRLWTTGNGSYGIHGLNDSDEQFSSPVQIGTDTTWAATGFTVEKRYNNDVLMRKNDGTLWAWGRNDYGELGLNDRTAYSSPMQVGTDTTWESTTMGFSVSLAKKTDGTLWSWGLNESGEAGSGDTVRRSSPTQVGTDTNWTVEIGSGGLGSMAIKTDGTLWTWGNGGPASYGQLGHNDGNSYSSPKQVGSGTDWASVPKSMGHGHTRGAVKTNGTLWMWGMNYFSGVFGNNIGASQFISSPLQIGTDTTWKGMSIGGSDDQTSVLWTKTDGTLWAGGAGTNGQLGQNDNVTRSSPVQVGTETTWDNTTPDNTFNNGGHASGAIKTDGTLWTWGKNDQGWAGQNNVTQLSSPKQVGTGTNWAGVSFGRESGDAFSGFFVTKDAQ